MRLKTNFYFAFDADVDILPGLKTEDSNNNFTTARAVV